MIFFIFFTERNCIVYGVVVVVGFSGTLVGKAFVFVLLFVIFFFTF